MASPKQTLQRLTVAQRRSQAIAMRIDGATYDQIARELGYANRSGAFKAVNEALKDVPRENVEEYRHLQIERLERVLGTQFALAGLSLTLAGIDIGLGNPPAQGFPSDSFLACNGSDCSRG